MFKENDNLEKLISDNREFFQSAKMPDGHLKRFEDRLNKGRKPIFRQLSPWLAAASIVIAVLIIPTLRQNKTNENKGVLTQVSDQYSEVEFYFTSSIHNSVGQLDKLIADGYGTSSDSLMIQEELQELELRHKQLQEDLKVAPNDERIVNAMIEVYQKKLELINAILNELEQVKQRKEKPYETTNL